MDELEESAVTPEQRRRRKRRAIWVLAVVAVLIALVITPPLINVNRLRRRIATSMSRSLGRPVHLDSVTLNILPVPGFTLQNLVVDEDPAFGSEPVLSAYTVTASLRASSLWRRHVEFGTIHFDQPSVNLVRRADGRWNFESILLHAAQEDAAPTAQTKPGPAPRFPYIEATGARLNVKLGDEKMPAALTEADFALWLPSPQQWKVRIEAKPARTDMNVSDTGILSIEATLEKAARLADVPIELTAAWRQAPLGEATRVLTGSDAGWRGDVYATATLHGTLGDAVLGGNLKLTNLRRAEFIPEQMLDVSVECSAHMAVDVAVLTAPACTVSPTPISHLGFGAVDTAPESAVYVTADKLELTGLKAAGVRVGTPKVSLAWLMDFARLWSQRTPATEAPQGTASGSFLRVGTGWQGDLRGTIRARSLNSVGDGGVKAAAVERDFSIASAGDGFTLAPFNVTFADKAALMFSATANKAGMTLRLVGSGTPHQVTFLQWAMPALADGFTQAMPGLAGSSVAALKVDLTCTREWGGEQTCVAVRAVEVVKPKKRRRGHRPNPLP
ncbi:MAG TPA: AsmA family protein [Acidobacteriaceae bacterium]